VSWASKKQPSAAASTMDAEYQACGAVALEGLSLVRALHELEPLSTDLPLKDPIVICCDDRAALSLCRDHKEGQRMKHIDVIHHFSRDHVESGALTFVYCNSCDKSGHMYSNKLEQCYIGLCSSTYSIQHETPMYRIQYMYMSQ
jgi:hypothetical protein